MFISYLNFRAINALALLLSILYRNYNYYVIKHIESNLTALPVKQTKSHTSKHFDLVNKPLCCSVLRGHLYYT